jgi:hypothetical protein
MAVNCDLGCYGRIGCGLLAIEESETEMHWVEELFRAAQSPFGWLSSAEGLQAAAETILEREEAGAPAYFNALEAARREAVEKSYSSKDKTGEAEVRCEPPNYLPAQLLYAFALENVFKGIMVANDPALANETELDSKLRSHNLDRLADKAGFALSPEERLLLRTLSEIAFWAGRYPVALRLADHIGHTSPPMSDPHDLLNFGRQHPMLRSVFQRAKEALVSKISGEIGRFGVVVALPSESQ